MAREQFLAYFRAVTAAEKDPSATLSKFQELLTNGSDTEITNALLFLQLLELNKMSRRYDEEMGVDVELPEHTEPGPGDTTPQ